MMGTKAVANVSRVQILMDPEITRKTLANFKQIGKLR